MSKSYSPRPRRLKARVRPGIEQLETRVFPGGFLDILAGAALMSELNRLLPDDLPDELREVEQRSSASAYRRRDTNRDLSLLVTTLPSRTVGEARPNPALRMAAADTSLPRDNTAFLLTVPSDLLESTLNPSSATLEPAPSIPSVSLRAEPTEPAIIPSIAFSAALAAMQGGSGSGYSSTAYAQSILEAAGSHVQYDMPIAMFVAEGEGGSCSLTVADQTTTEGTEVVLSGSTTCEQIVAMVMT